MNETKIIEKVNSIGQDDITIELLDELKNMGYDGKSGNPVLRALFKLYTNLDVSGEENAKYQDTIKKLERELTVAEVELHSKRGTIESYRIKLDSQRNIISRVNQYTDRMMNRNNTLANHISQKGTIGRFFDVLFRRNDSQVIETTDSIIADCNACNELLNQIKPKPTFERKISSSIESDMNERESMAIDFLTEQRAKRKESLYGKIDQPFSNLEDIKHIIQVYASLGDTATVDNFNYNLFTSQKAISKEDQEKYIDSFIENIVISAGEKMAEEIKENTYKNSYGSHLYDLVDMKSMLDDIGGKQGIKDVITRGREVEKKIEKINPDFIKQIEEKFDNSRNNRNRMTAYKQLFMKDSKGLTEEDYLAWQDYRAIVEEFRSNDSLGFHLEQKLDTECYMKFYVNLGPDTYKFARLFAERCKKQGLEPSYKVTVPTSKYEISRTERLCIYVDRYEKIEQYLKILNDVKKENNFTEVEELPLTAGKMDGWLGVGSDFRNGNSYNYQITQTLSKEIKSFFGDMTSSEILRRLESISDEELNVIRYSVRRDLCEERGQSPIDYSQLKLLTQEQLGLAKSGLPIYSSGDKPVYAAVDFENDLPVCVSFDEAEVLRKIDVDSVKSSPIQDQDNLDEFSTELLGGIQKIGYTGTMETTTFKTFSSLFAEEKAANQKASQYKEEIDELQNAITKTKSKDHNAAVLTNMYNRIINSNNDIIVFMKKKVAAAKSAAYAAQSDYRRGIFTRIRNVFRKQKLLPGSDSAKTLEDYLKDIKGESSRLDTTEPKIDESITSQYQTTDMKKQQEHIDR